MKKFYWKEFIKNIGGYKRFILFIITVFVTAGSIVFTVKIHGVLIVINTFLFNVLYNDIEKMIEAIKKTNEYYTIETNKTH